MTVNKNGRRGRRSLESHRECKDSEGFHLSGLSARCGKDGDSSLASRSCHPALLTEIS